MPILVIWFGIGTVPAVLTAFLISFFPIVVNVATGLATIEPETEDVLRALGARKVDIMLKVGIPRSMPYFFGSLKVAITLAFVGSVVSETVASNNGLGNMMASAQSNFNVPVVFAGLLMLAVEGIAMYALIVATMVVERLVAGQPGSAAGLVYLAGMMLPSGMGFPAACTLAGAPPPQGIEPFLQPTADGLGTLVPPEAAAEIFFQCADPADARAAAGRLNPQLNTSWMIVPHWTVEGAGTVPRLYIEALQDRSVPIAVQRTMQRLVPGARIETIDTDHAPQLSCLPRTRGVNIARVCQLSFVRS